MSAMWLVERVPSMSLSIKLVSGLDIFFLSVDSLHRTHGLERVLLEFGPKNKEARVYQ